MKNKTILKYVYIINMLYILTHIPFFFLFRMCSTELPCQFIWAADKRLIFEVWCLDPKSKLWERSYAYVTPPRNSMPDTTKSNCPNQVVCRSRQVSRWGKTFCPRHRSVVSSSWTNFQIINHRRGTRYKQHAVCVRKGTSPGQRVGHALGRVGPGGPHRGHFDNEWAEVGMS
jgi:hypothetical protein